MLFRRREKLYLFLFICVVVKITTGYSSNSSNISDYVNIVEITWTQHYRFPEQKMLGNDTMETGITEVMPIRRRNDIEKSTWRSDRYFADFESRIHVEISTSNRCHNFHVEMM